MPTICIAAGCSQKDEAKGILLHVIHVPFFGDELPEAQRRRKTWVNFVKQKSKTLFEEVLWAIQKFICTLRNNLHTNYLVQQLLRCNYHHNVH